MKPLSTLTGECFCGDVKYAISAPLTNARSCHCSRCRKAFSSATAAFADVEPNSFQWTHGADKIKHYGKTWSYVYCNTCVSKLCTAFEGKIISVALGTINGDPGINLDRHIFVGSKAPWDDIGGDAQQFDKFPPNSA